MENGTKAIMLYDASKKSTLVAYLLYFIMGFWLQFHRFYAGNKAMAFFLLLCPIFGVFMAQTNPDLGLIFIAIWFFAGVWDIFYIPVMVKKKNIQIIDHIEKSNRQ